MLPVEMRAAERQGDGEGRSPLEGAFGRDIAAVQLDEIVHQGQADAAALEAAALRAFNTMEALEQPRDLLAGDADACVGDADHGGVAVGRGTHRHRDQAFEGELEGVGDQVQDHLLPHLPVQIGGLGQGRAVQLQPEAGALDRRSEAGGDLGGEPGDIRRLERRLHPPRFDPREVEQAVDQPQQPPAIAQGEGGLRLHLFGRRSARGHVLQRAEHQGERGAELVADVGEECGLGAIELRQGLGPAAFLLVGVRIGDRRSDLAGRQLKETAIGVVEQAIGVQPDDQDAAAASLAGGRDRQHARRGPGPLPGPAGEGGGEDLLQILHQPGLVIGQNLRDRPALAVANP